MKTQPRWYRPSKPADFPDRPWLHESAILYLEHLLQPDWNVIEHGAGGSTIWIADRVGTLTTIEHDIEWAMAVQDKMPANVKMDVGGKPDQYLGQLFDLMFIDGHRDERGAWANAARMLIKPGGIAVFDNSNRPEYRVERDNLRDHSVDFITIIANPPNHSFSVTEFYRLPGGEVYL